MAQVAILAALIVIAPGVLIFHPEWAPPRGWASYAFAGVNGVVCGAISWFLARLIARRKPR